MIQAVGSLFSLSMTLITMFFLIFMMVMMIKTFTMKRVNQ